MCYEPNTPKFLNIQWEAKKKKKQTKKQQQQKDYTEGTWKEETGLNGRTNERAKDIQTK